MDLRFSFLFHLYPIWSSFLVFVWNSVILDKAKVLFLSVRDNKDCKVQPSGEEERR